MNEASKAKSRRERDPRYANRWFVGRGIDVGCGADVLKVEDWPKVTEVVPYDQDRGDGDAQFMTSVPDGSFDFVHASHVLEHIANPQAALTNWLRILKPGGFTVVTVPEELLYEGGSWPSRYNPDHRNSFTARANPIMPRSLNLLWLLWKTGADVENLTLLTEGWELAKLGSDQTLGPAECALEFVVRRPDPSKPW